MNIPDAQQVIHDLSALWPRLSVALEHGTNKVVEFFEREVTDKKIDPYLAPNLVRFHALQSLRAAGVASQADVDFNLQHVPNNGICLAVGKYRLRILKANDGGVPAPGQSVPKNLFYRQQSIKFTTEDGVDVLEDVINLLVVWDVTYPYHLFEIVLACPKHANETKASVALYWEEPLPFVPATIIEVTPASQEEDLPISLNQPATGTGEAE